ncbi:MULTISPECIES: hydroxymethylglutaryl-CoA synthase [unclassified Streptococcus]|uniref:hydroxymethylglutaryl-CoA synthase n=1 Tax=unclassified Streptococcus TaxID=2608887 RepID=UPI00359E4167
MTIGIDRIGFATSQYRLSLEDLAQARGVEPAKFTKGLMLDSMSITPITEDIVTMAASAASQILTDEDRETIDLIIFATETGIDQSKAASVFLHGLLGIQPFARSIEMKEACYAATAGLDYAKRHVEKFPDRRVLVIASDIAKYGIASGGEATQGAGALALIISSNPRTLILNDDNLAQTRDIMDFWRPNYSTTPYVQGAFSTQQYLDCLTTTWAEHQKRFGTSLDQLAAFCFHVPFPKLAKKGLDSLMTDDLTKTDRDRLTSNFDAAITYNRQIGNIYTGSLYLSLLSLLENSRALEAGDQIGLFSYGSGAVCEIFTATVVDGFEQHLRTDRQAELDLRTPISVDTYEALFYDEAQLDETGSASFKTYQTGAYALTAIDQHQRIYHKVD